MVVIRGAGDTFCSGYDLHGLDVDRPGFAARAQALVANPHHRLFDALERSDATVVAELGGAAIGGGLELAICCDLRFAADDATVAMPAGTLGLTYSHTGLRRFVETIGLAATKELFLLGRLLNAELTGWSVPLVKVRAFRARAEMRKILTKITKEKYL